MQQAVWFSIVVIIPVALAFGTGPPTQEYPIICETMQPAHGPTTAVGVVPFAIEVNTNKYKKAETILVTLHATEADTFFRGFFLQARQAGGMTSTAIGSFISDPVDGTQFIQCGSVNSAWGHAGRLKKTSVTATWMGPSTDIGALVFNATVVGFDRQEYWMGILSPDVTFGSANGITSHSFVISVMAVLAYAVRM